MKNQYQLLGVRPDASAEEIYAWYSHHRQMAGHDEALSRALDEAWWILGDAERRRWYDHSSQAPAGGEGTWPAPPGPDRAAHTPAPARRDVWSQPGTMTPAAAAQAPAGQWAAPHHDSTPAPVDQGNAPAGQWAAPQHDSTPVPVDPWGAYAAPQGSTGAGATPAGQRSCQECGAQPAIRIGLVRLIGLVLIFTWQSVSGAFCRDCGLRRCKEMTLVSLVMGWWGVISFFLNWIILTINIIQWVRLAAMPAPDRTGMVTH